MLLLDVDVHAFHQAGNGYFIIQQSLIGTVRLDIEIKAERAGKDHNRQHNPKSRKELRPNRI
ncbi:hypothetical protein D3C87_1862430 [compost metagenome]